VVVRLTTTIKRKAVGLAQWRSIDANYTWARFSLQLHGWAAPREFFAIRERVRENKAAVGRRLNDVDGYTFRVFVTNRQGDTAELWRDYNQLACDGKQIEELKVDPQADGVCMRGFFATDCAFPSVCLTYNLPSLYQHATCPERRIPTSPKLPPEPPGDVGTSRSNNENYRSAYSFIIQLRFSGPKKQSFLNDLILQWSKSFRRPDASSRFHVRVNSSCQPQITNGVLKLFSLAVGVGAPAAFFCAISLQIQSFFSHSAHGKAPPFSALPRVLQALIKAGELFFGKQPILHRAGVGGIWVFFDHHVVNVRSGPCRSLIQEFGATLDNAGDGVPGGGRGNRRYEVKPGERLPERVNCDFIDD
jgi:hypothetical protein